MSRNTVFSIRSDDDLATYLTTYPEQITFGEEPAADVFDRYHTDGFVLVNDGLPLDRQRLLDHVRPARKRAAAVKVDVYDALLAGDRVAARYVLIADMRKGGRIATQVHLFGRLAEDGRLAGGDQLIRTLSD